MILAIHEIGFKVLFC